MVRMIWFASIVSAALVLPSLAQASCTQADLTGAWKIYSSGWQNNAAYWVRCKLVVNSAGTISNSSSCTNVQHQTGAVTNGTIKIVAGSTCTYSAQFHLGGILTKVVEGTVARDKLTGTGVGTFPGGTFIFTMTKL